MKVTQEKRESKMELNFYVNLLLLFVSFVTLSLFFLIYKHRSRFSGPNRPPGRIGLPIIGESLLFLSDGWKGKPEKFILDRMAKYSSPIFKTSLFGEPATVFTGAACNKFLFSNENKLVTAWWPDSVNKIFPTSLQTDSKQEAKKMRSLLPQFLKPEALQRYIGVMDTIARRHFAAGWEGNDVVTVYPLAKQYTFWLACKIFVSVEEPAEVERLGRTFDLVAAGVFCVPVDLPGTPFRRGINAANDIRKDLSEIIKKRKVELAEGKATGTQDIMSHMLVTCDEDGKFMTEADIADKILGLLIAGHDTASAACAFLVKFLAELPHVYQAVYQEQMEIANSKGDGELLNWEDLKKMKYSWNVACEVMRLVPPLQGAFREVINEFIFNGYSIPKGWKVYWSTHSTHRSPECFPEPEKFDPARFEGAGPAPYTFVPFGGGPRMCPGKEYARLEILVFMHNLVKRFKWEKVIPDEGMIVDPLPTPAKGLPIRLFPHTT